MRFATRSPTAALALTGAVALGLASVPVALGADGGRPVLAAFSSTDAAAPPGPAERVPDGGAIANTPSPAGAPVHRGGRFAGVDGSPTAIAGPGEQPQTGILAAYRAEAARGVKLDEARATLSRLSEERVDGALLAEVDQVLSAETAQATPASK